MGDVYGFSLMPSGTNTLTFTIQDLNQSGSQPWSTSTWKYPPPNLNIYWDYIGDQFVGISIFSPASAVEGFTTNTALQNVPYMQTYVGYNEQDATNFNYGGGVPSGIGTLVNGPSMQMGYDGYYWAALSQTYVSSITGNGTFGAGSVSSPNNLVGTQNGNYATIYGGNPYDGGYINGQMNTFAGGNIYIYGYSTSGYNSNLYVWVSMDDSNWTQIGSSYITVTSSTPYWISTGSYFGDFKYIAVTGYDTYDSVYLHLDAVKVNGS